jgi:hypothetical protein
MPKQDKISTHKYNPKPAIKQMLLEFGASTHGELHSSLDEHGLGGGKRLGHATLHKAQ